ncbi:RNA polymerase sigma factor [Shewanella gaetbuli]|uniref:RNA polymerase sigma factor n=1 Tax=Shewanella gaetbuli TaxID=220752 RepID=A0A9X1ZFD1_9GAMM|nr:RNA polymerase sigma factor [Shewanella gaetbuli]
MSDTDKATAFDEAYYIAKASEGCQKAFQQLYLQHHRRVYGICFRLSSNHDQAQEITQNCFVRLWDKLATFKGESLFSTWLHQLCVRQAINDLKAQQRFWQRFIPIDNQHDATAQCSMPEIECHQLDKLIAQLPQRTKIVFVLCAIEGYQHEEVGQLLNIAVGTSKAQFHRAKQMLQEMLK